MTRKSTPVTNLPGAWLYGFSTETRHIQGERGKFDLHCFSVTAYSQYWGPSLLCCDRVRKFNLLYFCVTACTIVSANISLRYILRLAGTLGNKLPKTNQERQTPPPTPHPPPPPKKKEKKKRKEKPNRQSKDKQTKEPQTKTNKQTNKTTNTTEQTNPNYHHHHHNNKIIRTRGGQSNRPNVLSSFIYLLTNLLTDWRTDRLTVFVTYFLVNPRCNHLLSYLSTCFFLLTHTLFSTYSYSFSLLSSNSLTHPLARLPAR